MRCLVCFQAITINNFHDICSLSLPCLCHPCKKYLIARKGSHLFQENEWLISVIERLEKGDLALLQLFISRYVQEIKKQLRSYQTITILNASVKCPYPWGEVLFEQLGAFFSKKDMHRIKLVPPDEVSDQTLRIY